MAFVQKRPRKFGDRKDGHWVKDVPGLNVIMTVLFPKRTESELWFHHEIDITELLKFLHWKNGPEAPRKTTLFHCFVLMFARLVNERPRLNRFIQGARIYERDEIIIRFLAKKTFTDDGEEALISYTAKARDTIDDVSRQIVDEVRKVRSESAPQGLDETMNKFAKLPRLLLLLTARVVRFLDFWGKVPASLTEGDTNFSTVLVSNLGSIQAPAAYHHLNNYGTNSIVITIGEIHQKPVPQPDGTFVLRDFVDLGTTVDERIADGFYFAKSFKLLHYLCAHPELLEKPLEEESGFEA